VQETGSEISNEVWVTRLCFPLTTCSGTIAGNAMLWVQRAAHVDAGSRSAHTVAAGVGLPLLSLRAPWLGPRPRPQDAGA